jgi:hypothetical protein
MSATFVREFLTKYSFDVNEGPINRMNRALKTAGDRMKTAFNRKPIDANTGKVIEAEKAFKNLNDAADEVGKSFQKIAITMAAIGAAAGGLFLVAKSTADFADSVSDTAKALGVGTRELQRLRYAAQIGGATVEKMDTSLKFLARNAVEAAKGTGSQADAFKLLGVRVVDVNGKMKTSEQLILETSDAFARMSDGAQKTATAMNIFGRDGAAMLPFLSQGSVAIENMMREAEQLGYVLDEEALVAAGAFNDNMDRLKFAAIGLRNILGSELIPIFTEITSGIIEWVKANRELIKTGAKEWVESLGKVMSYVISVFKGSFSVFDRIAQIFGGWDKTIKLLTISLLGFGAAKILIGIGALGQTLWVLVKSIRAVGFAARWTQIQLFAIPLAIGAAVVAAALLIDDIITFFTDPEVETATGHFVDFIKETWNAAVQFIQDSLESIKGFMVDVGASIIEDLAQPLEKVLILINRAVKGFTGFDVLESIGWKTGEEGVKQRRSMVQGAADFITSPIASYDTGMRGGFAPSPEVRAATISSAGKGGTTMIENKVEINANGLSEQAAKELATQQFMQSQKELLRKAGNNSIPKNRE